MEQAWRSYLLAIASVFAKANGLALATVSRRYHGTDSFLADFANGHRTITLKKLDEMVAAFARDWPAGAKWPTPPRSLLAVKTPSKNN